jgi:TatD DNase family protein
MFYDAHCHLDLMDENELATALKQAKENNLSKMVSCSTSFSSNEKNLKLACQFHSIMPAIGLYPLNAIELAETEIEKTFYFFNSQIKNASAIGEVGLDFKHCTKKEDQEKQKQIFARFVQFAKENNKPIIIHSRFAQKQTLELLKENNAEKVLLHSFIDSAKLMKQASAMNYFISAGLSLLQNEATQKNIASFPLENLLFETDSPMHFNGEKVTPEKILLLARKTADLKNISLIETEKQLEKNFHKLFFNAPNKN